MNSCKTAPFFGRKKAKLKIKKLEGCLELFSTAMFSRKDEFITSFSKNVNLCILVALGLRNLLKVGGMYSAQPSVYWTVETPHFP